MADFKAGDRVRVRPEFDELAKFLGTPTRPGTVVSTGDDYVVVAEDNDEGPGWGSSAPYGPHELEAI